MLLHCYAVIPKTEERQKLATLLRHHGVQFTETTSHIAVDIRCESYKTVEWLISEFEAVQSNERGFTVIGDQEEVPYDTG